MVMDESVLFCTTASTGGSGGCFLGATVGKTKVEDVPRTAINVHLLFFSYITTDKYESNVVWEPFPYHYL